MEYSGGKLVAFVGFLEAPASSSVLARGWEDAQLRRAGTGGALSGQRQRAQLIQGGEAESQGSASAGSATHVIKGPFFLVFFC